MASRNPNHSRLHTLFVGVSFLNRAARYFTSGMELAFTICTPGAVSVVGRRRARPAGRHVERLQIPSFQRHIGVGAELLEKRRSALLTRVDTGIPNASAMFESVWWLRKARRLSLYSNDSARLPCKKKSGQARLAHSGPNTPTLISGPRPKKGSRAYTRPDLLFCNDRPPGPEKTSINNPPMIATFFRKWVSCIPAASPVYAQ
jgi:hypothetical protein